MKIAHVSDVHIRNLKYHKEYRRSFNDLYGKLWDVRPDIIVNTGDTAHTKTQISPEFVDMASNFIRTLATIAPEYVILGNHDLNLMNSDRQDAISPIVTSLQDPRVHLIKKSGRVDVATMGGGERLNFWVFSLADVENYPTPAQWSAHSADVNVGLFHGSIRSCVTDSNWRMTHTEHEITLFDGLDFVMMGDIHKRQALDEGGRIRYAGSLIQQNFGEDPDKGFLLWDIKGKDDFSVEFHPIEGSRKFFTVRLNDDLTLPEMALPDDSRLRISPPVALTLIQQKEIEKAAKRRWRPHDVITLGASNAAVMRPTVGDVTAPTEDLRLLETQERLIREYFANREGVNDDVLQRILDLNRRYQVAFDQQDDTARNVRWSVDRIAWSNFFNYGEGNVIDFTALSGLTGIFAPNASGKSNLIDVIMETLFDNTTKGISKNIFLINDNKDVATAIVEVSSRERSYVIERTVERIKYGQRKFEQEKEWGKTSCNFYVIDADGQRELLNGTLRPETERSIRHRIGTFQDCMLTSLSAQWNPLDMIACKETDRKKILFKFLDLDIFEQKCLMSKEQAKQSFQALASLEATGREAESERLAGMIAERRSKIEDWNRQLEGLRSELAGALEQRVALAEQRRQTPDIDRDRAAQKLFRADTELIKIEDDSVLREREEVLLNEAAMLDRTPPSTSLSSEKQALDKVVSSGTKKSAQIDEDRRRIAILDTVPCGDSFPQCRFLVDAFESRRLLPEHEAQLVSIQLDESRRRNEIAVLQEQTRRFVGAKKRADEIDREVENIRLRRENNRLTVEKLRREADEARDEIARYDQVQEDIAWNASLDKSIASLSFLMSSVGREIELVTELTQTATRELGMFEGRLNDAMDTIEQIRGLRLVCTAHELYSEAMGKDGIALKILTQKLPLINEEINKILANAADFSVFIEHDPEEQSIRLYLQYGEYKSRLIELGSGAEKMLASIALRTALLGISSLPKSNLFIIDEGFGKLDPKNLEAVQRMFDYLKSVFEHVLIVSHLDVMKDMVDNVIEITSDDEGYAHVEIGA